MQQPGSHQIQPIDSLTPFLGGKWWIRARVTDKTDIRTWNKPTSQGKLFSFTLIDESAAIRATVFNDAVDTFEPLIVNGQVYYFSGGQVKNANRRFSNVNNDYELTFDRSSEIMLARQDTSTAALPMQRYNFVPIELLKQREVGSLVDVLGVVLKVDEVSSITQKSTGRELMKRNVKMGDMTAAVEVTFWNDEAKAWCYPVGTVVALRQLKVGSFDGVTLSSTYQTKIDINPTDLPDVKKLATWYVATGGANVTSLSSQGLGAASGAGGESDRGRKYLDEIQSEGIGRGLKPEYVDVRCVPIYFKQDAQWYDACPTCNKKVTEEGAQGDRFRCEKCDKTVTPTQRYLVSIQVTDNVSQAWLTLFNEAGIEFFGMEAAELKRRAQEDPLYIAKLAQGRMNRPVVMRLRVKEEMSSNSMTGEESDRLRMSVVRISEFMPIAGTSEETRRRLAQNLRTECDEILRLIEAYV
ncbi:putative replication factor A, 51kDa subunit [Leishmania major strain Friedlin]|uniref:Replication protein A subunit n=1 Tax=Leishmania major TaxID=5664 RepID=Q4Q884_LEIMA|nr:putative replication factor A, 51kDa subunit [Leishmania major strain Friedlin]CAG9577292.1 Replication_factor_A_protein_1_(RPA1) [Leishmania major strain Friedlin]CAJ05550.1 putative replication factor A, 51kDa subunit [Leishmania major strain Friedlin]|eukprot:XP_001684464.1 putative replication factor A, 51kDa subunit [Leishmania major strain Friedlin]